jgi:2-keto-4-pentenoate hydratase/2-oxohepta-3-ene-1,7-dioic acid hydratase in catechol pathway
MKIARFSHGGAIAFGIVDGKELVVLKGDPMFAGYDTTGERVALTDATLLAPVIPRSKVIGMGNAFHSSAEAKAAAEPREPMFFLKPNTAVVGPDDPIVLPPQSNDVVAEGELAIVIGRIAKNVSVDDAAGVIFGYTIANDVTANDLKERDGQWARAKSFDSFCPVGPVIETDFDAAGATIEGRANGKAFQSGSMELAVHSIAEIVSFVSSVFTLLPGDLILTGAPDRAGAIVAGDTVAIKIPGIGVLSNPVRRA